jgi:transposase
MKIMRAIVRGERDSDVLAKMRDIRCKASEGTVRAALIGNYQPEHLFSLKQAVELYDFYQARVDECDSQIERVLVRLKADKPNPESPLPKPRTKTRQPNPAEPEPNTPAAEPS